MSTDTFPPASGQYREQLDARIAQLDEEIRYWRSVLDQAQTAGQWSPADRDNIRPRDLVKCRGDWRRVVRVNTKTITVETGYSWTDKIMLHEITDHRPAQRTNDGHQQTS